MNPFLITAYKSPEYFCNRDKETKRLISAVSNGRNTVLYSLRRVGKSGLIKNTFYHLNKTTDYHLVYVDIYNTYNTDDFVNEIVNQLLKIKKKQWFNKAFNFIKKFQPTLTFNPIDGQTEFKFNFDNSNDARYNLEETLNYFEAFNTRIVIAIDEFQQITKYPDQSFEGFLRSKIQFLNNISFIFSGSEQSIITSMFFDHSRPFYQSADIMKLDKLENEEYFNFISTKFATTKKQIEPETVQEILDWTERHTYYTQNFCNRLWGKGIKKITAELVNQVKGEIISDKEKYFIELRHLLPPNQLSLLRAIGKNNGVEKPSSIEFITKYKLSSTSTINSALKALLDKELIYKDRDTYKIYDVFLSRFLQYH